LTELWRAKDEEHRKHINQLRSLDSIHPVTPAFVNSLEHLSSDDFGVNASFAKASYAVTSNAERMALQMPIMQDMAVALGARILRWRKPLSPKLDSLPPATTDQLYQMFDTDLHAYFIEGEDARAILTENISPAQGLANGTRCTLHSIFYKNVSMLNEATSKVSNALIGSCVDIPCPDVVNVSITIDDTLHWPKTATVVPGLHVIPLTIHQRRAKRRFITIRESKYQYFQHEFELAFVSTIHKLQGSTLDSLVLEANRRPVGLKALTLQGLLTAYSRVQYMNHFRLMPLHPGGSFQHLYALKQDVNLIRWFSHIDKATRMWNENNVGALSKTTMDKRVKASVTALKRGRAAESTSRCATSRLRTAPNAPVPPPMTAVDPRVTRYAKRNYLAT